MEKAVEKVLSNLWTIASVVLFLVLAIGKAFGAVDMSWFWITFILWWPFALVGGILAAALIAMALAMIGMFVYYFVESLLESYQRNKRFKARAKRWRESRRKPR